MRRIPLPAVMRAPLLGVAVVLSLLGTAGVRPATAAVLGQTGAPSVSQLEQQLRAAQTASNAAVARFQAATAAREELVDEIASVQHRIDAGQARAAELRTIVVQRAVTAYRTRQVTDDSSAVVLGSGRIMEQLRRNAFLELANAKDDAAIAQLKVLEEDLSLHRRSLQTKRDEAEQLVQRLDSEKATLAAAVADAQRAYDELVNRLAREAASRAAAERAAQQVARPAAARGASAAVGTPVAGFLCPVRGSFTNDFGDPRSGGRGHGGTDMFASTGTPVVAVKSGSVSFQQEGAGGNAAYLHGSDGNTYYYAHLSSFAGSARSVAQGEVIGYVGQTGSATAPHLHFEIRTGGGAINPYSTLSSSC